MLKFYDNKLFDIFRLDLYIRDENKYIGVKEQI
jgi:hypothetical protein